MKTTRILLIIGIVLLSFIQIYAQSDLQPQFNGYIQLRTSTDFDNFYNFSVRRLKLWIKSKPDSNTHWSYKVQTTLTSYKNEQFFLQDVKIKYKLNKWSFDLGQFVPQYSLERFQPDYKIPTIERAKVINCLIPDGTLGVRDIGVQANYHTASRKLETHIGLFNGYGIKEFRFYNRGFMLTNKTELNFKILSNSLKLGYSIQWRKAENLKIPKVLPQDTTFTGNDFRYNLFIMLKNDRFSVQSEYLAANLAGQWTDGYYILGKINLGKSQLTGEYEFYKDLISTTKDLPAIRLGYNYLINKYKLKISLDNYFQLDQFRPKNYIFSIQLQVFIR